jgi:hypothetical protein
MDEFCKKTNKYMKPFWLIEALIILLQTHLVEHQLIIL